MIKYLSLKFTFSIPRVVSKIGIIKTRNVKSILNLIRLLDN